MVASSCPEKKSLGLDTLYFSYVGLDHTPFQMELKPTNPQQHGGVPDRYKS